MSVCAVLAFASMRLWARVVRCIAHTLFTVYHTHTHTLTGTAQLVTVFGENRLTSYPSKGDDTLERAKDRG